MIDLTTLSHDALHARLKLKTALRDLCQTRALSWRRLADPPGEAVRKIQGELMRREGQVDAIDENVEPGA